MESQPKNFISRTLLMQRLEENFVDYLSWTSHYSSVWNACSSACQKQKILSKDSSHKHPSLPQTAWVSFLWESLYHTTITCLYSKTLNNCKTLNKQPKGNFHICLHEWWQNSLGSKDNEGPEAKWPVVTQLEEGWMPQQCSPSSPTLTLHTRHDPNGSISDSP